MNKESIETRVIAYLAETKGLSADAQVNADTSLVRSGLVDSLGMEDLICFLEETFAIQVGDEDLVPDNFETVTAIASFVRQKAEMGRPEAGGG